MELLATRIVPPALTPLLKTFKFGGVRDWNFFIAQIEAAAMTKS